MYSKAPIDWNAPELDPRCKINDSGYVELSRALLHRVIWKHHHGKIRKGWVIHHINHVKTDNRLENLIAIPEALHGEIHTWYAQTDYKLPIEEILGMLEDHLRLNPYTKDELKLIAKREKAQAGKALVKAAKQAKRKEAQAKKRKRYELWKHRRNERMTYPSRASRT